MGTTYKKGCNHVLFFFFHVFQSQGCWMLDGRRVATRKDGFGYTNAASLTDDDDDNNTFK